MPFRYMNVFRGPRDDLVNYGDGFEGGALAAKWLSFDGGGTETGSVSGSEYNTTVDGGWDGGGAGGAANGAFWYNAYQGQLRYQSVSGNFDMRAQCRVRNLANSGLPTVGDGAYRIAGIAAHDPNRATNLNYVHVGFGCTASAAITCEWKTTVNNISTFGSVAAPTGVGELRIRRLGQVFDLFLDGALVQSIDRTANALPTTLQVGIMPPYASVVGHDLRLFVDTISFVRP